MKHLELVQDSFTQEHFDKQAVENKPYVAYSIKDNQVIYTIIPNEDGAMYTVYRVVKKDIPSIEYNAVDLGLPSGLKWADRNVGATSVEDQGYCFQWGGTEGFTLDGKYEITKNEFSERIWTSLINMTGVTNKEQLKQVFLEQMDFELTDDNVIDIFFIMFYGYDSDLPTDLAGTLGFGFVVDGNFDYESYFDTDKESGYDENGIPISFKKYHMGENGLTTLAPEDDAATIHMGYEWRIPTIEDFEELVNNTTLTFIDLQGNEYSKEDAENGAILDGNLKGFKLTGVNSNSMFIPINGGCAMNLYTSPSTGFWSSTLTAHSAANALYFSGIDYNVSEMIVSRYEGTAIRGVKPKSLIQ